MRRAGLSPKHHRFIPTSSSRDKFEKNLNRFEPGETQRMGICLFAQIHEETHPITVGKYTIQAAYKWDGQEYRSNKVMVEIVPK